MKSEDAMALMTVSTTGAGGTTPPEEEEWVTFYPLGLKVDADDDNNKRYTMQYDNYTQKVVDIGNRLIIVDNILPLTTELRSAMYDDRLRQAIDYVTGGINIE